MSDAQTPPAEEQPEQEHEQVLVRPNASDSRKYHTVYGDDVPKECPRLPATYREWPLSQAEAWDYTECDYCHRLRGE